MRLFCKKNKKEIEFKKKKKQTKTKIFFIFIRFYLHMKYFCHTFASSNKKTTLFDTLKT